MAAQRQSQSLSQGSRVRGLERDSFWKYNPPIHCNRVVAKHKHCTKIAGRGIVAVIIIVIVVVVAFAVAVAVAIAVSVLLRVILKAACLSMACLLLAKTLHEFNPLNTNKQIQLDIATAESYE